MHAYCRSGVWTMAVRWPRTRAPTSFSPPIELCGTCGVPCKVIGHRSDTLGLFSESQALQADWACLSHQSKPSSRQSYDYKSPAAVPRTPRRAGVLATDTLHGNMPSTPRSQRLRLVTGLLAFVTINKVRMLSWRQSG